MDNATLKQVAMKHKTEIMAPYDAIVDLNGFEAICAFSELMGGTTVYVPNKRTIFLRCLELEAIKACNGFNYREVARQYGFSERHFRRMMQRGT